MEWTNLAVSANLGAGTYIFPCFLNRSSITASVQLEPCVPMKICESWHNCCSRRDAMSLSARLTASRAVGG